MEQRASRTALAVTAYRARENARSPRLFADPWAAALAGDEGATIAASMDALAPAGELYIVLRTAFLDGLLEKQAALGVRQCVLLGAGFDVRAARLPRENLRYFEVDHPATQALKLRSLRALEGYPLGAATYVPCDFEREDFLDKLVAAGFDASAPALFLWEGVTLYLTEPAVRATLRRLASGCAPTSVLAFDFLGKRMIQQRGDAQDAHVREALDALGEPLRWGTDDVLPVLYDEGFRRVHVTSLDEVSLHFTGLYARERKFRFHYLAVASVARGVLP